MEALSPTDNQVLVSGRCDPQTATRERQSEVVGLQHVDGSNHARRVVPRATVGQRLCGGMQGTGA